MKTLSRRVGAPLFAALLFCAAACTPRHAAPEMVTVTGRVTDFDGQPLDSVTVSWMDPAFGGRYYTLTDADGRYAARIPKGRYAYAGGIDMAEYPNAGSTLPEADQRLEYWAWNFVADRDTVCDFRYHRMEVYGVNAFRIQGAAPGYTLYFRPMSLTRFQQWHAAGTPAGCAALAPPLDRAAVEVEIDGERAEILMAQEVREYFSADTWSNAYLLFVALPATNGARKVFRIVVEDLDNGDKGEATCMLEERTGDEYVWPEGEVDATYRE